MDTWDPKCIHFLKPVDTDFTPFVSINEQDGRQRCTSLAQWDTSGELEDEDDPKPSPPFALLAKALLQIGQGERLERLEISETSESAFRSAWKKLRMMVARSITTVTRTISTTAVTGTPGEKSSVRGVGNATAQSELALFDGEESAEDATRAALFFQMPDEFHDAYSQFVDDCVMKPGADSPRRIRIAVLDTGIDFHHLGIADAKAEGRKYADIVDGIENAIQYASARSPRITFAAASNNGKNERRAFTARSPVAAGIAAAVLDLMSRVSAIDDRTRRKLRKSEGMEKMFGLISSPKHDFRGHYSFLAPGNHWDRYWQANEFKARTVWDSINNLFDA
ncbi:hypothetical protein CDD83_6401 [Cordyceps sp. RAO-2017]|nr:hypothetical protein CDD83_6401 [Cordyceps sp. RAO-2017]